MFTIVIIIIIIINIFLFIYSCIALLDGCYFLLITLIVHYKQLEYSYHLVYT